MTNATITAANIGMQFMEIMQDYQERQNDDPNFDPRTQLFDLYEDLCFIYEHYEKSQDDD